jgi:hypothetical protein
MIPNCKYIMHTTKKELKTGPQVTRPHWDWLEWISKQRLFFFLSGNTRSGNSLHSSSEPVCRFRFSSLDPRVAKILLDFSIMADERLVYFVDIFKDLLLFIFSQFLCFRVSHPLVVWAQRKDLVFLTIRLEDTTNPEIKLDEEKMYFRYSIKNTMLKYRLSFIVC